MRALAIVATIGWAVAGLFTWLFVASLGWFGLAVIGLFVWFAALRVESDEEFPDTGAFGSTLLRQRFVERIQENSPDMKLANLAARAERHRWLYVMRTAGMTLVLLGAGMLIAHELAAPYS
jgi:hypothetical protein